MGRGGECLSCAPALCLSPLKLPLLLLCPPSKREPRLLPSEATEPVEEVGWAQLASWEVMGDGGELERITENASANADSAAEIRKRCFTAGVLSPGGTHHSVMMQGRMPGETAERGGGGGGVSCLPLSCEVDRPLAVGCVTA